jgi:hypothetical protein
LEHAEGRSGVKRDGPASGILIFDPKGNERGVSDLLRASFLLPINATRPGILSSPSANFFGSLQFFVCVLFPWLSQRSQ